MCKSLGDERDEERESDAAMERRRASMEERSLQWAR